MTGFGEPVFANMPFHATFQQLVEKIRGTMREGESLAGALARLQGRGALPIGRLTPAQRIALDRMLDTEIGSLTSGELFSSLGSPGASLFSNSRNSGFKKYWHNEWDDNGPSSQHRHKITLH